MPEPSEEARIRHRFRYRPHGPVRDEEAVRGRDEEAVQGTPTRDEEAVRGTSQREEEETRDVAAPDEQETPATETAPAGQGDTPRLEDIYPLGSIVDVHYPRESQWYTGKVVKSWIYKPRSANTARERRIIVEYDDGEQFEHGLNNSEVRLHEQPTAPASSSQNAERDSRAQQRELARIRRTQRVHQL